MRVLSFAPRLTLARLRARTGNAWLDILAVLSFTLAATMALTIAGGIFMFYNWNFHPSPAMAAHLDALSETLGAGLTEMYLGLALFAGALLVIPISSLASGAARLGAQDRSQRLASLRLVGTTRTQTIAISLCETVVQWLLGTALGTVLYLVTLPGWRALSFLGLPINPAQMLLPVPFIAAVIALLFVVTLVSALGGLMRVSISPLGVARRETPRALRAWRLAVFAVAGIMYVLVANARGGSTPIVQIVMMAGVLLVFLFALSVAASFIVQALAYPLVRSRHASLLMAARRILNDPRAVWRSVSTLALLCFIGGYTSTLPERTGSDSVAIRLVSADIGTGVMVTLGFGFAVVALSSLTNHASLVFESAQQTQSLRFLGFPTAVFTRIRILQTFIPLVVTTALTTALGVGMSLMTNYSWGARMDSAAFTKLGIITVLGLAMCLASILVVTPLETRVVLARGRAND
ncbi:MAG: hypothetical protein QP830_08755 [Actinotignum sanguinis]|uniref:hypothetical protein n=1 Tax=Actinomycetaceae TaxID=2049 RepID=UPI00237E8EDF|nr:MULTISPECIES: hypothetical protein [Actinotignum]MDK6788020.1 hypothetical protein [Actinotignum timonense]MDE1553787.1 hypothetical protein [Actinotignum sanguinis]MDE1566464.1 hypothetical protein [Actinotignum sanguinis]MDE1578065.1 hypothetical protein [Actinotignum sanguinis]MDE1643152.1 hypothetical protein [Actinotignum sanguinis]